MKIKEIEKKKFVSFDLETTSLDYIEAQIVGISLACDSKKAYYIPLLHEDESRISIHAEAAIKAAKKTLKFLLFVFESISHNELQNHNTKPLYKKPYFPSAIYPSVKT